MAFTGGADGVMELRCSDRPESAGEARRFVRDALMAMDAASELVERVVLVASELATNAILHARTPFVLRLEQQSTVPSLRLSIDDASPLTPAITTAAPSAESGRGLAVVQAFTSSWGIEVRPGGKSVWAQFL